MKRYFMLPRPSAVAAPELLIVPDLARAQTAKISAQESHYTRMFEGDLQ